jgi:hypothetical protein
MFSHLNTGMVADKNLRYGPTLPSLKLGFGEKES